jgi:hypothetical protein
MTTDETTTAVAEAPAAEAAPAKTKATLEELLAQYVALREGKAAGTITAEQFDSQGRTLRRQIRAAGGSVNSLKPESTPADGTAKPAKEPKAKKAKKSKVEANLDSMTSAQPAGLAHVDWMQRIFTGAEQLGDEPQVPTMIERSQHDLEQSGDYGYGLDVLSDVTPRVAVEKFVARFGYNPTWFVLNKPADFSLPSAVTLLILGPVPSGDALADDVAEAPAEAEGDEWGDEETEEGEEDQD